MSQVTVTISGTDGEVQETIRGLGSLYGQQVTIQSALVVAEPAKAEKTARVERASKPVVTTTDQIQNGGTAEAAPVTPTVATPTPTPTTATATVATPTSRQKTISEMIPAALKKVSKDKVVELLASFGAKKGSEIKPADEERFISALRILVA